MSEQSQTQNEIDAHLSKQKSRRKLWIIGASVAVVAVAAAITIPIVVQNATATAAGTGDELIPLTIADTAQSDFQDAIVEVGRENGLDLTFVNFDDPYLPNPALLEGEVDGNSFQHVAWLSQFNKELSLIHI